MHSRPSPLVEKVVVCRYRHPSRRRRHKKTKRPKDQPQDHQLVVHTRTYLAIGEGPRHSSRVGEGDEISFGLAACCFSFGVSKRDRGSGFWVALVCVVLSLLFHPWKKNIFLWSRPPRTASRRFRDPPGSSPRSSILGSVRHQRPQLMERVKERTGYESIRLQQRESM